MSTMKVHDDLAAWRDRQAVEAVRVRSDRYVFGTGRAEDLERAFEAQEGINSLRAPFRAGASETAEGGRV